MKGTAEKIGHSPQAPAPLNTCGRASLKAYEKRQAEVEREMREEAAASAGGAALNEIITAGRTTGNAHRVIFRNYNGENVEAVSMRLEADEQLMRGGGAGRKHRAKEDMDESTLAKSKQRARSSVRRKCFAAGMDRMLTLTFRENVTDLAEAWEVFKYFSRLMRWRFKDRWFYVCVPEFQKRGAVHFHLAISGFFHANTVRRFWLRAAGHREGNVDITSPKRIGKNSWNPRRIASYLTKYITKEESVGFNSRRYSSGGEIPEPEIVRGWVALGLSMSRLFRDLAYSITRKQLAVIWEGDDHRGLLYCST